MGGDSEVGLSVRSRVADQVSSGWFESTHILDSCTCFLWAKNPPGGGFLCQNPLPSDVWF